MANRAYLLSSSVPSSDREEIEIARRHRGLTYVEVGEACYRIPVPWLLCFAESDLRDVKYKFFTGPDEYEEIDLRLPWTSAAKAKERLRAAGSIYPELFDSPVDVRQYWARALDEFESFPFEFLTVDPVEVLAGDDLIEEAAVFASALREGPHRLDAIRRLAGIDSYFAPFSYDEFFNQPPDPKKHHVARNNNSAAMDPGIHSPQYQVWHRPPAETAATAA